MMNIKTKSKEIKEIIRDAKFLGSGASKEAFIKDDVVYKIPRGRYLIEEDKNNWDISFPVTIDEVNGFLKEIDEYEPTLVWPLGQFVIEIIIWEAIEQLRSEGLEINCFAEILDYYCDKNGVIVIEQEATENVETMLEYADEELIEDIDNLTSDLRAELDCLAPILKERFNIVIRDIRNENCGLKGNHLKLFDFGISTTTDLDYYDGYSF